MNATPRIVSGLFIGSIFGVTALVLRAADAPATPAAAVPVATASGPYHFIKEIHIGGAPTWDYLAVDPEGRRLYVSHGNAFTVIDVDKDEVVGEITGLSGVHGIAFAPKLGLGYISNGRGNNVSVIDLKTLAIKATVDTGTNPDWIMYEPGQNEVYAFNGGSQSTTVFDAATFKVVATIPLGGKPESAAPDPVTGRVYDNIEDKSQVAAIDTKTHAVVATWPNAPAGGASGIAYDLAHHRLFLGCGDTMAMMDSTNGKVLATLPAAAGIDAAAFDPGTQYAFTSGGSGAVTIAKEDGDKLTLVQTLATTNGARTMTIDPTTHKIYLATVTYQAPATPVAGATPTAPAPAAGGRRGARPTPVADSFKIMVYGMDEKK